MPDRGGRFRAAERELGWWELGQSVRVGTPGGEGESGKEGEEG